MESEDCAQDYFSWDLLRTDSRNWAASTSSEELRWQTLCVAASWVIRFPETWGFCYYGALALSLLAFFCTHASEGRIRFFDQLVNKHRLNGWLGILSSNWYIFEIIARGSPRVQDHYNILRRATDVIPMECEGDFNDGMPILPERHVLFDAAQAIAGVGAGLDPEPFWQAKELVLRACTKKGAVPGFSGATACLLRAVMAPSHEEVFHFAQVGEQVVIACMGRGTESMLTALLWSRWPFARLLALIHDRLHANDSNETVPVFTVSRELIGSWVGAVVWNDLTFPWVRHLADTVPLHELYQEFPWPYNAPSYAELCGDVTRLLDTKRLLATTGGAGYGMQWASLCFVCKDGEEDLDTSEGTIYKKTPVLEDAPAIARFIDLFGETGRVRLSAVMPGGIIGWHPDNGVAESGRMIIHVPMQTSDLALNRLGHLLFHMPHGRIHWLDYSYPHTVYNGDPILPRIHLVIDVKVPGNTAFEANFLRRLEKDVHEQLLDAATQLSTDAISGRRLRTLVSRGMSADMAAVFSNYILDEDDREAYERNTWEYIASSRI